MLLEAASCQPPGRQRLRRESSERQPGAVLGSGISSPPVPQSLCEDSSKQSRDVAVGVSG